MSQDVVDVANRGDIIHEVPSFCTESAKAQQRCVNKELVSCVNQKDLPTKPFTVALKKQLLTEPT